MSTDNCKGCSENVHTVKVISEDEINTALLNIAQIKKIKLAEDEIYRLRLDRCKTCDFLEAGTTCLKCGCIVQIRAKLKLSRCPLHNNDRWRI